MLRVLDTGLGSASENMAFDEKLLRELDPKGSPILHHYGWKVPAVTHGYFLDPKRHIDLEKAKRHGLEIARRPTGGGMVFHLWDLAFSFLMPAAHPQFSESTLENYRFVNEIVLEAVELFLQGDGLMPELISGDGSLDHPECRYFCMARATKFDVVYRGAKIAGAAQRKMKGGYLHQGSISLGVCDEPLLREVLLKKEVVDAMMAVTFIPRKKGVPLAERRCLLQQKLTEKFVEKLGPLLL